MSADYKQLLLRKSLELDFPEIDEKQNSEIPLELKCRIENVLSTLKEAIEKFKISLILPKILENPKVLQQHLQNTKYDHCLELVRDYRKGSKTPARLKAEGRNSDDEGTCRIVEYFQDNYQMLKLLPNWMDDIDAGEKQFLKAFQDVCQIAEERFQRSAITDLAKEKRLHAFYLANEEMAGHLKEIKQKVQQKRINLLWKHAAKSGAIQKLEEELAFIQYDNHLFAKKEMSKSQREIERISSAFVAKQQELEEDLMKARSSYEAKLKKDLSQEKSIQDERNKIQLQLLALVKKYDQTIYEKHAEEILLREEHNKQKQLFEEFLKEHKREEEIYEELVIKRQRLQEAKALMFACTRAAIKIQKWWKVLRKSKRQKKKHKTTKDKKSTEQANGVRRRASA